MPGQETKIPRAMGQLSPSTTPKTQCSQIFLKKLSAPREVLYPPMSTDFQRTRTSVITTPRCPISILQYQYHSGHLLR